MDVEGEGQEVVCFQVCDDVPFVCKQQQLRAEL